MLRCPSCTAELDDVSRFCANCGQPVATGAATIAPPDSRPPVTRDAPGHTPPADVQPQGRFLPGTVLARRYRLVALLGRGGMGEVYRADDTRLGHTVALKFLPDAVARDAATLERFYAEVRIGRQVSHPNVVRLYDLVEIEEVHCLVMEYVDGEDLSSLLARIGRLPPDKAVDIARDLCGGLGAAHDKGVIHRDLKPANVMIDGKGRARIADFGIAALAGEMDKEAFAGTPAYMAPELLDGQPASVRSDLYALGLVLYEVCTGKRLFEARSLSELKALQQRTGPLSLSSTVRDIPPAMERVVLRCLERDPTQRPASAHEVMAALPGGDPLQAAMAAGETPSPAMVAAAGQVGDLDLRVAWACLLAGLLALFAVVWISGRSTALGRVAPPKSTELLREKGSEIAVALGFDATPADRHGSFLWDEDVLRYVAAHDRSPQRWDRLASLHPGPLQFVYRQSPRALVAWQTLLRPLGPSEAGRITIDDPPATVPGMLDLTLDPQGRLLRLNAVPRDDDAPVASPAPDWAPLFAAAGIDTASLDPVGSPSGSRAVADSTMAWTARYAGQPDVPLRIEAAAFRGRPVWFDVQGPWRRPPSNELPPTFRVAIWLMILFSAAIWTVIAWLVRRNLRLGRGDRRGALRLSVFLWLTSLVALLLRADHVALAFEEISLVTNLLAQSVLYAAMTWLIYVALEPVTRRRLPHQLVGWSRLLAGRWHDPLVGRDVLVGAAAGIAMTLMLHGALVLPEWLGNPPPAPRVGVITSLTAFRQEIFFLLSNLYPAVCIGFGTLFGLMLRHVLPRSLWIVLLGPLASLYFVFGVLAGVEQLWSLRIALFTIAYLAVARRAGFLAAVACLYAYMVLEATPLTLDASAWYADRTWVGVGLLVAMLAWAFHAALGGKPMFGTVLQERD
jgi:serine/threonine-protein kinase